MSAPSLRLAYKPDDDWLGRLHATVISGAFSGHGSAWFDRGTVKDTFVKDLRAYPLSPDSPPLIEGGFRKNGVLEQCHLRIALTPFDVCGTILVWVDLASEAWKAPDIDRQQSVTVRFLCKYQAVAEFADALEQVLDGKVEHAVLSGESI